MMSMANITDISYGREAEVWPRDYAMLARRVQYLRFNDHPVKLVSCNSQFFIGYIAKFNQKENLILASNEPKGRKRIEIHFESLASLEELSTTLPCVTHFVPAEVFNTRTGEPTRKDYFSICNKCFKQGVGIKVHMLDGRILTGTTTGVNACQVGLKKSNGNHIQILFDWVRRITSIDYIRQVNQ